MNILFADIIKILIALVLGGMIGIERDIRDKAAGFRTLMFICVGSTLFTILSSKVSSMGTGDIGRIAANIVSGVGFLGAGVILRERGQIKGLTTASTIWLVAAIGMAVGAGEFLFSLIVTIVTLIVLWFFPLIERHITDAHLSRTYTISCKYDLEKYEEFVQIFKKSKMFLGNHHLTKKDDMMKIVWDAYGTVEQHKRLVNQFAWNADIINFGF